VAGTVGRVADPLSAVSATARGVGRVASEGAGYLTGRGGETIRQVAKAGYEGQGPVQRLKPAEVVDAARAEASRMRQARSAAYQQGKNVWGADKTVQNFAPIDQAVQDTFRIKTFEGQSLSPSTQKIRQQIADAVSEWQQLDPAKYHTVEGLDALKQKIGDIRDATQPGTPERLVAKEVYGAIRGAIIKQAPDYAKAMKAYENASKDIKLVEKALGQPGAKKASTSLKRLQEVLGENAHLVTPGMLEKLAGQALNVWTPQFGKTLPVEAAGYFIGGHAGALKAMLALPFASPRLAGEAAYYTGKAARGVRRLPLRPAGSASYQAGRGQQLTPQESQERAARARWGLLMERRRAFDTRAPSLQDAITK
jgi:hypothetical protein